MVHCKTRDVLTFPNAWKIHRLKYDGGKKKKNIMKNLTEVDRKNSLDPPLCIDYYHKYPMGIQGTKPKWP